MEALLNIINNLSESLKQWQPIKLDYQHKLDKKIRLELNYNSNHIEGNTLTYGETELLLIFDKTTGNHEWREYEEMKAHDAAFEMIKDLVKDEERPLNEAMIKNLHEVLLVRPFWKDAITPDGQPTRRLIEVGEYKKYPNSVRLQNGEIFSYTSVEETPIQMGELIEWYRAEEEKKELHPVTLAALLHYKFVRIHPFDDGNGRLSRLLMNYVLLKHNLPVVIIKSDDKRNYLFALNQADAGDLNAFVRYVAEQMIWSLEICIAAAKGENIDESEDWSKKLSLLKRKLGEDPKGKVELIIGVEAISNVIKNSFIPLALKWEEKLIEFDVLLMLRIMHVALDKHNYTFSHLDEKFENYCKGFLESKETKHSKVQQLSIKCSPKGLRKSDKTVGFNGGEFAIYFFQHSYELSYTNQQGSINKLYNQALTENEIEIITNDLSNFLYNNIEQFIESTSNH